MDEPQTNFPKNDDAPEISAPTDLPRVPKLFWAAHPEFDSLQTFVAGDSQKVLDALGPPPFPKTGFPFVGFLATVYEHVSTHVQPADKG